MKINDIFCSENEFMNNINIKDKQSEEYIYQNIFLCPLNNNDCVNSMDIFDDILIYGTIMGNVYLCRVDKNNLNSKKIINKNSFKNLNINNSYKKETKNDIDKNTQIDEYEIKIKKNSDTIKNDISKIPNIKLKIIDQNNCTNNNNNKSSLLKSNTRKENDNKEKEINIKINNKLNESNKAVKEISSIRKNTNENYHLRKNDDLISLKNNKNNIINNTEDIIIYPQVTNLITNATENISCVAFESKDNVIISVGDLEIIKLEKISTFNINDINSKFDYTRIKNYTSEEQHIINCENTTCFLTSTNFLIINTFFEENDSPITMQQIPYKNKKMENLEVVKGNIDMFSFCVPFDFDGDKFLFLDYQTKLIRRICIYYTLSKEKPFIYKINKDFGHISHMKLLYNDRIFLCRNEIKCEIYKINDNFTLLEEWTHTGEEIIAVDIYMSGTKISQNFNNNNLNNLYNIYENNENNDNDKNQSTRRVFDNEDKDQDKEKEKDKDNEIKIKFNSRDHNHKKNIYIDINKSNHSSFRELQNFTSNKWNYKKQFKEENYFNDKYNSNNKNNDKNNKEEIEIYNKYKSKSRSNNKDYYLNSLDNEFFNLKSKNKENYLKLKTNEIINNNSDNLKNMVSDDDKLIIATLDQNGNVNIYKNKKNSVIFNLYKIPNIEQRYKDEEFFSAGFPYFIIMNSIYFAISTDHGIFVIMKCKK